MVWKNVWMGLKVLTRNAHTSCACLCMFVCMCVGACVCACVCMRVCMLTGTVWLGPVLGGICLSDWCSLIDSSRPAQQTHGSPFSIMCHKVVCVFPAWTVLMQCTILRWWVALQSIIGGNAGLINLMSPWIRFTWTTWITSFPCNSILMRREFLGNCESCISGVFSDRNGRECSWECVAVCVSTCVYRVCVYDWKHLSKIDCQIVSTQPYLHRQ